MSWYKQVKTIYSSAYLMFIFICYSLVVELIFKERINFLSYFVMLASVLLMQYLLTLGKPKETAIEIPAILSAIVSFFMYPVEIAAVNIGIGIAILIFLAEQEKEDINHEVYKNRMKVALFVLTVVGIVAPSLDKATAHWIFRYYILFLIFAILTLREARNYCNKIKNKKSTVTSLAIVVIGLIATTDFAFSLISKFYIYAMMAVKFMLSKASGLMSLPIFKPLRRIIDYIISRWRDAHYEPDGLGGPPHKTVLHEPSPDHYGTDIVSAVVILILVVCMMRILADLYKRINNRGELVKGIEKEKIYNRENKQIKDALANLINKIFRKEKTVRGQIIYIYGKFQNRMKLKDIFKPWMTATQLSNVAKVKIDDFEALDSIKTIYNEAKFSVHELPQENVQKIKDKYEEIKKY